MSVKINSHILPMYLDSHSSYLAIDGRAVASVPHGQVQTLDFQAANGIDVLQMYFTVYVGMNDYSHLFNNVSCGHTEVHWLRYHLHLYFYESRTWCRMV